jgi:hypothetical protein
MNEEGSGRSTAASFKSTGSAEIESLMPLPLWIKKVSIGLYVLSIISLSPVI